ncbi:MAG: hypothetical protein Q4F11_09870 [Eubacteriales bacterium]|nr:hypothetical protein [Eubacteriales bacterium]
MDNYKDRLSISNIGIATIITVFIVLSLVTFASLSYVNAKNDYNLSRQVSAHNEEYYDAANQANQQIAAIAKNLSVFYNNIQLNEIPYEFNYEYTIGESHTLYVTIVPSINKDTNLDGLSPNQYLKNNNLPAFTITRFEVATTASWDGDNNLLPLPTSKN